MEQEINIMTFEVAPDLDIDPVLGTLSRLEDELIENPRLLLNNEEERSLLVYFCNKRDDLIAEKPEVPIYTIIKEDPELKRISDVFVLTNQRLVWKEIYKASHIPEVMKNKEEIFLGTIGSIIDGLAHFDLERAN